MRTDIADPGAGHVDRQGLIEELKVVRRRGTHRLRGVDVPLLQSLAAKSGFTDRSVGSHSAVRDVLARAADSLGDGTTGAVARVLFGLEQGLHGRRPQELREKATDVVVEGTERFLTVDTFRRNYEPNVLDRLADELLGMGEPSSQPRAPQLGSEDALRRDLATVQQHLDGHAGRRIGDFGPYEMPVDGPDGPRVRVFVHAGPVEELTGVQLLVSSENTYLEPARMFFSTTLSGHLRRAAARFDEDGRIVQDVVADELRDWVHEHGRPGVPVRAGTVVRTSPGSLERSGVVRILHAAVIAPRSGVKGYDVAPDAVIRAVRRCFELARDERELAGNPTESWGIQLPLFGAGDGGLSAASSFSILWHAASAALRADPSWDVHLSTWETHETATVLEGLLDTLGRT